MTMAQRVTDEDVDRFLEMAGRPKRLPKGDGGTGRGSFMESVALCLPKDDPFANTESRAKGRAAWEEEHPPGPVRHLMKDGVWLVPQPQAPGSSRTAIRDKELIEAGRCRRCGKPRGGDGTSSYCRPCADFHAERFRRMRAERTEEERQEAADARRKKRHARIAAGLCKRCGRPRGEDGNPSTCRPCGDKLGARARRRRASGGTSPA